MLTAADIKAFKDYVSVNESGLNTADSTVIMNVTHSHLKSVFPEIRFDRHTLIEGVKRKLSTMCGTAPSAMVLRLQNEAGETIATMGDDHKPLGYYSPYSGCTLHVIDQDPGSLGSQGWLEDVSKVEKYVISEEDYSKRSDTARKFKERMMQQQQQQEGSSSSEPAASEDGVVVDSEKNEVSVGQRCCVFPGDKRGSVKFVGAVPDLPSGSWVGVEYDEPLGKNDGSVKGTRYFECPPNHGGFVRPDKVRVGDFPPLDDFSDLDSGDEI